jgi:hypothetical protein
VCEFYLNTCPPDYFVRHYAEKAYDPAPDETKQFFGTRFPAHPCHLVGMLKPSIIGRGSGWKHDHTAVLVGHEEDKPHVVVYPVRPGKEPLDGLQTQREQDHFFCRARLLTPLNP